MSGDNNLLKALTLIVLVLYITNANAEPSSLFANWDILDVEGSIPRSAAGNAISRDEECNDWKTPITLTLPAAVKQAWCASPRSREAWANIKAQTSALGISRASYLPTLSANVQSDMSTTVTAVEDHPEFSSGLRRVTATQSLTLDWLLLDFGRRRAVERTNIELLTAAHANHAGILLEILSDIAKDYYAAQAYLGALNAALSIEETAIASTAVALGRVERGVAPISDSLQAQTALADASLARTKAEGDRLIALGGLANRMGLAPDTPLTLLPIGVDVEAQASVSTAAVSELIALAQASHPRIAEALARQNAASERVAQANAEFLPKLSFSARASHNNAPVTASLGASQLPAMMREKSIGLQLSIPIFDGLSREYQKRQLIYQVEAEKARLDAARQQVAADVWNGFQGLQVARSTVSQANALLLVAQSAYDVSKERYFVGVGMITDLLNAQSALATAKRRQIQAFADWRTAQTLLTSKLGTLSLPL